MHTKILHNNYKYANNKTMQIILSMTAIVYYDFIHHNNSIASINIKVMIYKTKHHYALLINHYLGKRGPTIFQRVLFSGKYIYIRPTCSYHKVIIE